MIETARGIKLLPGENRREYVLTVQDEVAYLEHCTPLLRAVATIILDTGISLKSVIDFGGGQRYHGPHWEGFRITSQDRGH